MALNPPKSRRGRPRLPEHDAVRKVFVSLAATDAAATAAQLQDGLEKARINHPYRDRTLRSIWADAKAKVKRAGPPSPWSSSIGEDPLDRAMLLRFDLTSQVFLGRRLNAVEASWARRNRDATSGLDDFIRWQLAREYAIRNPELAPEGWIDSTHDLDLLLAVQPWKSDAEARLLETLARDRQIAPQPPILTSLALEPYLPNRVISWLFSTLRGHPTLQSEFPSFAFNWASVVGWRLERESVAPAVRAALEGDGADA
jgi:hypothetical protein